MGIEIHHKDLDGLEDELMAAFDEEIERRFATATAIAHETLPELQERIHVDTGALRASARLRVHTTPDEFEAVFTVGRSPEIDYAVWENARRGHNIWGPLDEKAEKEFSEAFGGRPSETHGSLDNRGRQALS